MQLAVTYVAQQYKKKYFISRAFYYYYFVDKERKYVRHSTKGKCFAFS